MKNERQNLIEQFEEIDNEEEEEEEEGNHKKISGRV